MNNQSKMQAAPMPYTARGGLGLIGAIVLIVLALAGCGGSDAGSTSQDGPAPDATVSESAGKEPGSAAREAGRRACAGMTAREAARRFEARALQSRVRKRFVELVADPPSSVGESAAYPRLVGALYATTVPPHSRAEAAAGCAEELAAH